MHPSTDIQQQAREWTPDMVTNFLEGIGLVKYAQKFLDEEINGTQLLTANREVFNDLGVVSIIDCTKISVLFRRELQGDDGPSISLEEFLKSTPKLSQFKKVLTAAGIDVDMMKYAQENGYLFDLLKECGVTKAIDKNRFESALNELQLPSPPTTPTGYGASSYVAYSTPV